MIDFPIIDSHIHLVDQERFGTPALKRDWTPDDLAASAKPYEIEGFVFVEVDVDMPQYLDEADWVDDLASHDRRVLGAVVCLPLERGAAIEPEMARIAKLKAIRGVRRLIQNQPDPDYVLKPGFLEAMRLMPKYNLSFDICVFHPQLPNALKMMRLCPEVAFVLDHIGKPGIKGRSRRSVARPYPRNGGAAECRLQALRTHHRGRSQELDARAIATLYRPCGRMLWAGPHSLRRRPAGLRTCRQLPAVAGDARLGDRCFSKAEKRKLFRDNAVKAYRLSV
jgi:L-fuconolactonase